MFDAGSSYKGQECKEEVRKGLVLGVFAQIFGTLPPEGEKLDNDFSELVAYYKEELISSSEVKISKILRGISDINDGSGAVTNDYILSNFAEVVSKKEKNGSEVTEADRNNPIFIKLESYIIASVFSFKVSEFNQPFVNLIEKLHKEYIKEDDVGKIEKLNNVIKILLDVSLNDNDKVHKIEEEIGKIDGVDIWDIFKYMRDYINDSEKEFSRNHEDLKSLIESLIDKGFLSQVKKERSEFSKSQTPNTPFSAQEEKWVGIDFLQYI
ncbi:hypothetical protein L3V79_07960 [Thiotrichales bacterium 19S9-12]|nr:hypothetical protein [Thiotrichales bacterium 19S9-11]MCF6812288.1 hypothetical protein [Thiotrichales bacterium 19S9-12]